MMRLRLKIVYLFPWYLSMVKKWLKMGITGMGFKFCLTFRRHFLGLRNFRRKIEFRSKGFREKGISCFQVNRF